MTDSNPQEWLDSVTMETMEYEKPCGTPKCPSQAKWIGWVSHSAKACPNSSFACDDCKEKVTAWWTEMLVMDPVCAHCVGPITGQMGDNLRWMPL